MKGGILFILAVLIVFMPIAQSYEFDYFSMDSGSNTDLRHGFNIDGSYASCNITTTVYHDNSTASMQTRFSDPYSTFKYYSTSSLESNNCIFSGDYFWTADNNDFEIQIEQDYTTNTHTKYSVKCPETSGYIYINASGTDSDSYLNNAFCLDSNTNMTTANFNLCDSTWTRCKKTATPPSTYRVYALPFKAGYNSTNIYMDFSASFGHIQEDFYFYVNKLNDSSMAYGSIDLNDGNKASYTKNITLSNLSPLEDYVVILIYNKGGSTYSRTMNDFHIRTLDYVPTLSCSDWSSCNNITNKEKRLCTEISGVIESYYEYRTCTSEADEFDEFKYIGFRDLEAVTVPVCIPNWTILGCNNYVVNKTVYKPKNWDVVDFFSLTYGYTPYRFSSSLDMSGFKFKIWNTVPKPNEAVLGSCINFTSWSPTYALQNITNSTMSTRYNITFPSDNMKVWFSIKKCSSQAEQYSHEDSSGWFGFGCGDLCYSGSCDDEVQGGYSFSITNMSDVSKIVEYTGEALDEWRKYYFDLSSEDFNEGEVYRIELSTYDPDFQTKGTCLELWDFGYGISDGSYECESFCDDETFHYFKSYINQDNICVSEDTGLSNECIENDAYLTYIESCSSYCDKNQAYHVASNISGICYWTVENNADICASKKTPISTLIPDALADQLDAGGYTIVNDITSIFGIIMLTFAILCFILTPYFPPISLVGMIFLVFMLTTFGYIPAIITGVITVVCLLLFARFIVDYMTGGRQQ